MMQTWRLGARTLLSIRAPPPLVPVPLQSKHAGQLLDYTSDKDITWWVLCLRRAALIIARLPPQLTSQVHAAGPDAQLQLAALLLCCKQRACHPAAHHAQVRW